MGTLPDSAESIFILIAEAWSWSMHINHTSYIAIPYLPEPYDSFYTELAKLLLP
jgi:hypothetical protein